MTEEQRRQKLAEQIESIIRDRCYIPPGVGSPFVPLEGAAKAVADWFTDQVVWQGDTELTFFGSKETLPFLRISPLEDHRPLQENVRYRTMVYPWREKSD